jgi:hypothetical protein
MFLSHNKLANSTFQPSFSAKQTGPTTEKRKMKKERKGKKEIEEKKSKVKNNKR